VIQTDYRTVFEIGIKSFPWGASLHPIPFIVLGVLLVRFAKSKQIYQIAGAVGAIFATLFLLIAAVSFVPNFVKLRHSYRSGQSSIVEGIVENFHPAPVLGAARESFSVHGIVFSYNVLDATPVFIMLLLTKAPSGRAWTFASTTKTDAYNEWISVSRDDRGEWPSNAGGRLNFRLIDSR
jgi:hypothetical protein